MWMLPEQDPLCTSPNEESGPLANNTPLSLRRASAIPDIPVFFQMKRDADIRKDFCTPMSCRQARGSVVPAIFIGEEPVEFLTFCFFFQMKRGADIRNNLYVYGVSSSGTTCFQ